MKEMCVVMKMVDLTKLADVTKFGKFGHFV